MIRTVILLVCVTLPLIQGSVQFIREPIDRAVKLESTIWWRCSAHNPVTEGKIIYRWRFESRGVPLDGRHHVFENGTLRIHNVSTSDLGWYQCLASDNVSQAYSRRTKLQQAYMAHSFRLNPEDHVTRPHQSVVFYCEINSVPQAALSWQRNGRPLVNRGTVIMTSERSQLTLENVTYDDVGLYRCRARNHILQFNRYSEDALLQLEGKPRLLVEPSPVTLPVGHVARLWCAAQGFPAPVVTWYDSRNPASDVMIEESLKYALRNDSLFIRELKMADAGFYTCRAVNTWGQRSKTVLLTVTQGSTIPHFTQVPEDTTVFAGETVTWSCSASGRPAPLISWDRAEAEMPEQRVRLPYAGTMQLLDVGQGDAGIYVCRAAGDDDVITYNWTLTVQERPLIEVGPEDKATIKDQSVSLDCRATGRPQPELTWTLPDGVVVPVPGSSRLHAVVTYMNGTLIVPRVQERHSGRYTCTARNVVGAQSASAVLYVYYGPELTITPTTTTVMEGAPAFLHCAGSGYPEPTVTWYGPGSNQTLRNGRGMRVLPNGTLVLENVYRWQEGRYTCVIENRVNQMIVSAELRIMVPPSFVSSPLDVVIREGATVAMPCVAEGRPTPDTRWQLHNEETLVLERNMNILPNGTLIITGVTSQQYGAYVCIASSEAGMRAQTSYLRPDDIPVFTVVPQNGTGNVSSTAHFKCSATARASPTVRWYRASGSDSPGPPLNSDVMNGRGYVTHDADLVFEELLPGDEGWYLCVAENSYGRATSRVYLDIKVPPRVMPPLVPIVADEGQRITLRCPVTSDPVAALSWQPPRSTSVLTTTTRDYVMDGDGVTVRAAQVRRDAGRWRCRACNYLGCDHGDVTLHVNGGALLVGAEASRDTDTNITHMRCVAAGSPRPEVTYDWAGLPVGGSAGQRALMVEDEWLAVSGAVRPPYGCTATNELGTDRGMLTAPAVPVDLQTSDVTNTSMSLSWHQDMTSLLAPSDVAILVTTPEVTARSPRHLVVPVEVTANGGGVMYTPGGSTSMTYTLDDLQPYTRYRVQVAARNLLGQSEYTIPYDVTMESGAPTAPTDLRADFSEGKLIVLWNRPLVTNGNSDALEYEVKYHSTSPGGSTLTSRVPSGRPLVATFSGTRRGDTVDVRVSAINMERGLRGPHAQIILVINEQAPSTPPVGVLAYPVGERNLDVEWQPPPSEDGVVGYVVAVSKTASRDFIVFRLSSAQARSHRVKDVDAGSGYYVKVAAYNYGGVGPYSPLVTIDMPQTGGALKPQSEAVRPGLGQSAVIGIVAGCAAVIFLVLLALLACCHYHRHRRHLLEKDIDAIYQQNQTSFYDNEDFNTDTMGSKKSVLHGFYDVKNQHGDSRTSTLSRVTSHHGDQGGPGPPDVLPTHRTPAEGTSLPDVHHRLGAADYELAEVTYGHSPTTSHYSTVQKAKRKKGSSGTGTYAELDLPPTAAINPIYADQRPHTSASSGQRRLPSSDVVVLSVADVWSLAPSSSRSKPASSYNTGERTTHFTNQTFRPLPAPSGRDPRKPPIGRDPRHPVPRQFETLTSQLDFESESSDDTGRAAGGAAVGSQRGSHRGSPKMESGFSPDITFWQTTTTDHSASLF